MDEFSVIQLITTSTDHPRTFCWISSPLFLPLTVHPSKLCLLSFPTLPFIPPITFSHFFSAPLHFPSIYSLSLSLWLSSCPVREWVISSKLIWPLMIGLGTYSSVSDWPRDREANFPWCSWRIVVALNYHLLCVRVYVCVYHKCVPVDVVWLHACARLSS